MPKHLPAILTIAALLATGGALAYAQAPAPAPGPVAMGASATGDDVNTLILGWACTHQTLVLWAMGLLVPFGLHFLASISAAVTKKFGWSGTDQIAFVRGLVKVIRAAALDFKPPPATMVANAAAVDQRVATAVFLNPVPAPIVAPVAKGA
jgi:hypothetical protein